MFTNDMEKKHKHRKPISLVRHVPRDSLAHVASFGGRLEHAQLAKTSHDAKKAVEHFRERSLELKTSPCRYAISSDEDCVQQNVSKTKLSRSLTVDCAKYCLKRLLPHFWRFIELSFRNFRNRKREHLVISPTVNEQFLGRYIVSGDLSQMNINGEHLYFFGGLQKMDEKEQEEWLKRRFMAIQQEGSLRISMSWDNVTFPNASTSLSETLFENTPIYPFYPPIRKVTQATNESAWIFGRLSAGSRHMVLSFQFPLSKIDIEGDKSRRRTLTGP